MNLEQSLEVIERRAEASRLATVRSLVAVVVCYVALYLLFMARNLIPYGDLAILGLSLCTWIALIAAGVFFARHWGLHRPALERGRIDLQIAMFAELQRQMNQLVQRLDSQAKS